MQNRFGIEKVLQCPSCGASMDDLECSGCGKSYSRTCKGIYDFAPRDVEGVEDSSELVEMIHEEGLEAVQKKYMESMNEETLAAKQKVGKELMILLQGIKGTVLEIASGLGGATNQLINEDVNLVVSDISLEILKFKDGHILKGEIEKDYFLVATDAKNTPFKDETFDHVVSIGAISNVPEVSRLLEEIERVLKKGGSLIATPIFIDKGSKSEERAMAMGADGVLKENLKEALSERNFCDHELKVISSAEAPDTPYDALAVGGEMHHYAILKVKK